MKRVRHSRAESVQRSLLLPIVLAAHLIVSQDGPISCWEDPTDKESANAFLVEAADGALLIDAGWSAEAEVPGEYGPRLEAAAKVFTHFHFDHVRRLAPMRDVRLSAKQASLCATGTCAPSQWLTVFQVDAFRFERVYVPGDLLPAGVEAVACSGHSQADACFVHPATRTLFPGDLFYLGPLFTFLPGGSLRGLKAGLEELLKDDRWDRIAQTHGPCYATRADFERAVASYAAVVDGEVPHRWSFELYLPLWVYPLATGSVVTVPFARQLDL